MKNAASWRFIQNSLEKGLAVMLLYVVDSQGSSPGRQGFMMALNSSLEMCGSIGGGIMEHKWVELAKEKLRQAEAISYLRTQIHNKTAPLNQSGMICSGEQTIFIYRITEKDHAPIQNIISCLESEKNGALHLSPQGIHFEETLPETPFSFHRTHETDWQYTEKLLRSHTLFIIGAGHCALALSNLMRSLDFYIYVLDDRKDLNTFLQNQTAHQKIIVPDYGVIGDYVPAGADHYVVIMTLGYRTDAMVLRALIHRDYAYLGMLGSKAKTQKLFAELEQEGVSPGKLAGIYAPIGMDIHSQTPEEIAVSIAGEIIRVKNSSSLPKFYKKTGS